MCFYSADIWLLRERFPYLTRSCKSQLNSSNSEKHVCFQFGRTGGVGWRGGPGPTQPEAGCRTTPQIDEDHHLLRLQRRHRTHLTSSRARGEVREQKPGQIFQSLAFLPVVLVVLGTCLHTVATLNPKVTKYVTMLQAKKKASRRRCRARGGNGDKTKPPPEKTSQLQTAHHVTQKQRHPRKVT